MKNWLFDPWHIFKTCLTLVFWFLPPDLILVLQMLIPSRNQQIDVYTQFDQIHQIPRPDSNRAQSDLRIQHVKSEKLKDFGFFDISMRKPQKAILVYAETFLLCGNLENTVFLFVNPQNNRLFVMQKPRKIDLFMRKPTKIYLLARSCPLAGNGQRGCQSVPRGQVWFI